MAPAWLWEKVTPGAGLISHSLPPPRCTGLPPAPAPIFISVIRLWIINDAQGIIRLWIINDALGRWMGAEML